MNPLLRAEQAVLGAVLLDPGQLSHLDWLSPDHFYRPVHQALFAALRKLKSDGHPTLTAEKSVPLSWVTDAVAEAGLHVRGLTAVYAHTLISACPRSAHAPVYGRMVLEGAIHRSIAAHAIRLHQAARADALQGGVEGSLHYADVLTGVLGDLARRWGTEPRPVAPATPLATVVVAPPQVRADQIAEDERFLLAVLAERPKAMDEVVGWLRPGDFADPAHGQLYRCLAALHHRGEPIDRITLLWEAQRRGLLTDGTLSGDQVTAICDGVGAGSAEWLGEQVLRASVARTAAASAQAVRSLAENEALPPGQLINHALHALGPLDEVRTRWQAASGPPAPKPSATEPSPNGPPTAQVRAALTRSTPRRVPGPTQQHVSAPTSASARSPARGHS
ncbi:MULTISPECIES: DnaB-like helicase N-terminal domain-containing protein [unclassified Streptomyces]|uniref:DnaB-like helicase N-terminal domain-containing protein n=1 Tax=unclassified Streptomyces TaxID=2593676 RepID=UPI002259CCC6|nr:MULTISPECIES: DnaB-like helicase N-terminal domain-containing protein [unclassified Streptomyces]MCX4398853.1 helicase DnaB [Streptomyces sp. NBC_01767]WSP51142.1 helicase DnaB [Streptomyces sp. NBC_01243]